MRIRRPGIARELSSLAVMLLLAAYGGGASGAEDRDKALAAPAPRAPHVANEVIVRFLPEFHKSAARSRVSGTRLRAFRLSGLEHHRLAPNVGVPGAHIDAPRA
jgi:hypothetical protein